LDFVVNEVKTSEAGESILFRLGHINCTILGPIILVIYRTIDQPRPEFYAIANQYLHQYRALGRMAGRETCNGEDEASCQL